MTWNPSNPWNHWKAYSDIFQENESPVIWNGASHGYKHVRKVFPRCCFQVKYPQHKVNRLDGSCSSSVQEGKEFQWEKNQRIRLSIHAHTASRWQVRCCIISLRHLEKYLEQMRICVQCICSMHASFSCNVLHMRRLDVRCAYSQIPWIIWYIMIHFYQQTFSESPSIETSSHAACVVSSNAVSWGCGRMPVYMRTVSPHLQSPSAKQP